MTGDPDANLAAWVAAAAETTVAAGTARLFNAWCEGSPVPQPGDSCGEGVADFAHRRADMSGSRMPERLVPAGMGDMVAEATAENPDVAALLRMVSEPHRTVYDGARELSLVGDQWRGTLGDADGPYQHTAPLWPLEVMFGANDDAVELAQEPVRDVATIRCRLTVDLFRADERLASGVSAPEGPLRRWRQMPAEVWLDDAGLARRIAVAPQAMNARRPHDGRLWYVTELWDFGIAVTITPPHPDDVTDLDTIDWAGVGRGTTRGA